MTTTRRVASTDGVEIALHDFGGGGAPLIICHATGFHGRAYAPLAAELEPRFHVWAIDFRGHGASTPPADGDFAWRGMAADLLHGLDEIGDGPAFAVGHSMGGAAILLAELARPGSIRAAYLYEPIVFPHEMLIGRRENVMADMARRRRSDFPSKQAVLDRYGSRPPLDELHPEALAAYVEHGFVETDEGVRLACLPEHEARTFECEEKMTLDRLFGLSIPLTVGAGAWEEGPNPAALAPGIVDVVEDGRLIDYADLGHFGPLQDPQRIAADIIAAFVG